jgi:hypothetical protein
LLLGLPNLPAAKNGTVVPLLGTAKVTVFEKGPAAVLLKTTAPAFAAELAVTLTLTTGAAPVGSETRIRQVDGAHVRNLASLLALLLISNATIMATTAPLTNAG